MLPSATAQVPASTANLGPGFDCLGLALNLYNTVTLTAASVTEVMISGEGLGTLPLTAQNLVLRAASLLAERAGFTVPAWRLEAYNEIPLARGLGSSSAAIVGGLLAANELLQINASPQELLDLATEIEGHPDNVAPALFGGLTVCAVDEGKVTCLALEPPPDLHVAVAIPAFEVSTEAARQALPDSYSRADAVYNVTHSTLTLAALRERRYDLLGLAMADRLHQPYRAPLVPGLEDAIWSAVNAGAYSAALSGSGPTVAAFCAEPSAVIEEALRNAFARQGLKTQVRWLRPARGALDTDWTMAV